MEFRQKKSLRERFEEFWARPVGLAVALAAVFGVAMLVVVAQGDHRNSNDVRDMLHAPVSTAIKG